MEKMKCFFPFHVSWFQANKLYVLVVRDIGAQIHGMFMHLNLNIYWAKHGTFTGLCWTEEMVRNIRWDKLKDKM